MSCAAPPGMRELSASERWVLWAELALRRLSRVVGPFLAFPAGLSSLEENLWLEVPYKRPVHSATVERSHKPVVYPAADI